MIRKVAKEVLERLVKYYHENKLSHAYLLETNNIDLCFADLKQVIKKIECPDNYSDICNKCNLCNLIDQNYLPSLIVLEPDGINIKKEQVIDLKKQFSMMPVYTRDNIYIIKGAEKLNGASANTILKFIEEPEPHIIGFFISSNNNNVIPTIKSRCEILKNYYDNNDLDINTIFNDVYKGYTSVAINYLEKIELEKKDVIMYNKDIILSNFKEREDIKVIFKIILIIYDSLYQDNFVNSLTEFNILSKNEILKRINLVIQLLDDIESNVNIELLLDKFVIELGDFNE